MEKYSFSLYTRFLPTTNPSLLPQCGQTTPKRVSANSLPPFQTCPHSMQVMTFLAFLCAKWSKQCSKAYSFCESDNLCIFRLNPITSFCILVFAFIIRCNSSIYHMRSLFPRYKSPILWMSYRMSVSLMYHRLCLYIQQIVYRILCQPIGWSNHSVW